MPTRVTANTLWLQMQRLDRPCRGVRAVSKYQEERGTCLYEVITCARDGILLQNLVSIHQSPEFLLAAKEADR